MAELRRHDLVRTRRGPDGGYWLARPADQITLAEVIIAVDGSLSDVRGVQPEQVRYAEPGVALRDVWLAVRRALEQVLLTTTVADVANGSLPDGVIELLPPASRCAAKLGRPSA